MHEDSPLAGLTDSQQATLLRALLSQNDRSDITIQNLSGGLLNSTNLVEKLKTATGVKVLPALPPSRLPSLLTVGDVHLAPGSLTESPARVRDWGVLLNLKQFMLNPFNTPVTLKLPCQCSGWAAKMRKLGYKVSSRSVHFGRQEHTITKGGLSVTLIQGGTAPVTNKVTWGSLLNTGLMADLRAVGLVASDKLADKEMA